MIKVEYRIKIVGRIKKLSEDDRKMMREFKEIDNEYIEEVVLRDHLVRKLESVEDGVFKVEEIDVGEVEDED